MDASAPRGAPTSASGRLVAAALAVVAACGVTPVVLASESGTGNATLTIDSPSDQGWDLHWSYRCAGPGVFAAEVFDSDRTPDFKHPGVNEEGGGNDAGTYHVPGKGRFYLEITSTCSWTVKVTASG